MRKRTELTCITCEQSFYPKSGSLKQLNCSRECSYKYINRDGSPKKGKSYPHLQRAEKRSCLVCGKEFRGVKDFKDRKQKYCSKACWNIRGTVTMLVKECRTCSKSFRTSDKRKIFCDSSCGHKRPETEQPAWKGDAVSYSGLHKWVSSRLGKPKECEHCHAIVEDPKGIHWANKSQEYKRDLSDWLRLCRKCHMKYDNNSIEISMRKKRGLTKEV